jgi:hypothetical protein
MVCRVHFQKPGMFSFDLGRTPPWGTGLGFIWTCYNYETSEISPQGEQLETDEAKIVCLPFVLEIEDPIPHFQTP